MQESGRRVLGDRYELDELIAAGGMGQVWRGRDTLLGRQVAVKLLRSEYTADPTFLARFRAEATHAAALSHPNIAAVYDYGEAVDGDGEHLAYLVMELVEGEPLSTRLEAGPLSPAATLEVLRQTAEALAEAHHAGLVHRDVKPGNILVSDDEQVKITDFGIAWSAGSVPLTDAGQVLGTPRYLSPELAVGEQPSPASDVYSLGLVGYECLTGQPAFDGDNAVSIALKQVNEEPEPLPADVPAGLRELVDVAVAKDPGERLPDGDAFVAAIDLVRTGRPLDEVLPATAPAPAVPAPPPAPVPRDATQPVPLVALPAARRTPAEDRPGRRRGVAVLAAVVALLLGIVAVVLIGLPGDDGAPVAGGADGSADQTQSIVLDDEDYVGRPVEDVAVELAALGLTVQRQAQPADGAAPGSVIGLDAVQDDLQPGDAVTVFFAAAEPTGEPTGEPGGAGTGTEESAVVGGGGSAPGAGGVGASTAGDGGTTGAAVGGTPGGGAAGTPEGAATSAATAPAPSPETPAESSSAPAESASPSTDPATPSTEPTDPTTDPTTPSTDPTTPSTEPTDPTTPSTDPTTPGETSDPAPPPSTDPTGTTEG